MRSIIKPSLPWLKISKTNSNPLIIKARNAKLIIRSFKARNLEYAAAETINNSADRPIVTIIKNNVISSMVSHSHIQIMGSI